MIRCKAARKLSKAPVIIVFFFSELFEESHLVDLPGKTWDVHTIDYAGVQAIDFSTICSNG